MEGFVTHSSTYICIQWWLLFDLVINSRFLELWSLVCNIVHAEPKYDPISCSVFATVLKDVYAWQIFQ